MTLALAHAAAAAARPFNDIYYATIATVIPVLYLAVVVQGSAYENLLKISNRGVERMIASRHGGTVQQSIAGANAALGPVIIALLVILFGAAAEIQVLLSLFWRRDVGNRYLPVEVAIFLIVVAASGPLLRLVSEHLRHARMLTAELQAAAAQHAKPAPASVSTPPSAQRPAPEPAAVQPAPTPAQRKRARKRRR